MNYQRKQRPSGERRARFRSWLGLCFHWAAAIRTLWIHIHRGCGGSLVCEKIWVMVQLRRLLDRVQCLVYAVILRRTVEGADNPPGTLHHSSFAYLRSTPTVRIVFIPGQNVDEVRSLSTAASTLGLVVQVMSLHHRPAAFTQPQMTGMVRSARRVRQEAYRES